jgi:two-component system sensor histidine kinase HydH
MAASRWPRWQVGGALIRRFALLSFLVIGATTAALSVVISSSLQADMLAREWYLSASFVRLEAAQWLTPADFDGAGGPAAGPRFRGFSDNVLRMPESIRVKLYDRTMTVVWSDEPRLIGQRFAENPQLSRALGGETVAHLETSPTKEENVFEPRKRFVELYVPLAFPPASDVVGIAEIYKTAEDVFGNIRRARRIVVGTALTGGALLWLSLAGIVVGAARRIDRQHEALEQRTRDLSAANEELHKVQAQLVAAERLAAIGEVVAAVAHGIRNPLANIRASAQVAQLDSGHGARTPMTAASLVDVISEVDRLEARVGDLLQFVRPAERRRERVDVNDVLRESLRTMKERTADSRVQVEPRLTAVSPIVGDFVLLEQAFGGIIENALDAMGDGGTLTLSTGTATDATGAPRVVVEVADSGPGVPAADVARIFDVFYTTKAQGTGLGLALARKFIEAYDGTLELVSAPGEGAAFRATFPVAAA